MSKKISIDFSNHPIFVQDLTDVAYMTKTFFNYSNHNDHVSINPKTNTPQITNTYNESLFDTALQKNNINPKNYEIVSKSFADQASENTGSLFVIADESEVKQNSNWVKGYHNNVTGTNKGYKISQNSIYGPDMTDEGSNDHQMDLEERTFTEKQQSADSKKFIIEIKPGKLSSELNPNADQRVLYKPTGSADMITVQYKLKHKNTGEIVTVNCHYLVAPQNKEGLLPTEIKNNLPESAKNILDGATKIDSAKKYSEILQAGEVTQNPNKSKSKKQVSDIKIDLTDKPYFASAITPLWKVTEDLVRNKHKLIKLGKTNDMGDIVSPDVFKTTPSLVKQRLAAKNISFEHEDVVKQSIIDNTANVQQNGKTLKSGTFSFLMLETQYQYFSKDWYSKKQSGIAYRASNQEPYSFHSVVKFKDGTYAIYSNASHDKRVVQQNDNLTDRIYNVDYAEPEKYVDQKVRPSFACLNENLNSPQFTYENSSRVFYKPGQTADIMTVNYKMKNGKTVSVDFLVAPESMKGMSPEEIKKSITQDQKQGFLDMPKNMKRASLENKNQSYDLMNKNNTGLNNLVSKS